MEGITGMKVVLIANGFMSEQPIYHDVVRGADLIICADGGANIAMSLGWYPDVLVGDMDSVAPNILAELESSGCAVMRHSPRKDETDLELALKEAVERGATEVVVLGATGGRVDHTIANVMLLSMPVLVGKRVTILDGDTEVVLIRDVGHVRGCPGDTVSLIPICGDARGVTTEGLEWQLSEGTLAFGYARGVSNVLIAPVASITVGDGLLLVTHAPVRYPWVPEKTT